MLLYSIVCSLIHHLDNLGTFFGVYDGHGGRWVSELLRDKFHFELARCIKEARKRYHRASRGSGNAAGAVSGRKLTRSPSQTSTDQDEPMNHNSDSETDSSVDGDDDANHGQAAAQTGAYKGPSPWMVEGIQRAFKEFDAKICAEARAKGLNGGSTAVIAIVEGKEGKGGKLWVAHVGDSRAVLCRYVMMVMMEMVPWLYDIFAIFRYILSIIIYS